MTGTEVDVETQAQRIAARGREALVERLRTAYSDAAAAHADLISLDEERIETMVQSAVDRADGLQWRRALARVASDELGLSVPEALSHPAVARAQAIIGAPSYEQSLAEMIARPVPPPLPAGGNGSAVAAREQPPAAAVPEPEPPQPPLPDPIPEPPAPEPPEPEPVPGPAVAGAQAVAEAPAGAEAPAVSDDPAVAEAPAGAEAPAVAEELEAVEADDVVLELLPEPEPIEYETEVYDVEASFAEERVPPVPADGEPPTAEEAPGAAEEPLGAGEEPLEGGEEALEGGEEALEGGEEAPQAGTTQLMDAAPEEPELTIPAIHLGGVANLPTKREGLRVRLSADGLDIMQSPSDIIGRLVWDEIETLEVPNLRVRRRAKQLRARLVVRTPHGDASFEVPDVSADDLRDQVEPLLQLYGRH